MSLDDSSGDENATESATGPRERLEKLKRTLGNFEIRDYQDAAIAELIAIVDLIVPGRKPAVRDEGKEKKGRRCHACERVSEEVGDGYHSLPFCAGCSKAHQMGYRCGEAARELKDPPKWPPMPAWADDGVDDKPLPEDAKIDAVHPATCESPRHDLYAEAMRLVGARRSKGGLVMLVHWLLLRIELAANLASVRAPCAPMSGEPVANPSSTPSADDWTQNHHDAQTWIAEHSGRNAAMSEELVLSLADLLRRKVDEGFDAGKTVAVNEQPVKP